MKITICRLLAFALLAILPACSKKPVDVTGQVFVVTKGRENIKMGGLEVRVIPDGEFQQMAKTTLPWMQEEVRKEAQARVDGDFITAFIHEVLAMEEAAPAPIPELSTIRKAIVEESGQSHSIVESALSSGLLKRGISKLISGATSTLSVTTDADGRFTVPITGNSWFIAAGQREVGKETEEYLWVKDFEPPAGSASATLAISNEADIDSEDGLYSLLGGVAGAPGGLDGFRKVEVSEKIKSLIVRHREAANAANAKAGREAAEAKTKAEREAGEANAKAEQEAAEAKAKLIAEIGAGRVGATLALPLQGKAMISFSYCPAGSFTMGSLATEDGRSNDENQVRVKLTKGFWMAKTELTQAQWQAATGGNPSTFKGDTLPVENVSWDDAQEFIRTVNASGIMPDGWKMALPTEAQWEYACRAGETGPYSGSSIDQVAWYHGNSGNDTHEVGTKKPNAWGQYDMHGNVYEWCADWYGETLPGGTDPSGAPSGYDRVVRGGSWNYDIHRCRAGSRTWCLSDYRGYYLGFRPALVPSK